MVSWLEPIMGSSLFISYDVLVLNDGKGKDMSYKIVASDLDGTLLNSKGELSPENAEAIKELFRRGVNFVPASGRAFLEMPRSIMENPNIRYYIHSSGAAIYDKLLDKRTLFCIPKEIFRRIFETIYEYECYISVRINGKSYADASLLSEKSFEYYNVWKTHCDITLGTGEFLKDFREEMLNAENIEMISLFFHNDADIIPLSRKIKKIADVNITKACPHNMEITHKMADKGNALDTLAKSLSVPLSEVIALGDSGNDIPMLETAGRGIAMSNSMPELIEIADEVICSNDEHGVKYILEKYF